MKETVHIINPYGQHLIVNRFVYDFSGKQSLVDKAIAFLTWSGMLAILALAVSLFV